jgi:hypothetical protein
MGRAEMGIDDWADVMSPREKHEEGMDIHTALGRARFQDKALRCREWPEDTFVYHGMDNVLRWPDGREFHFSIADLLSTDWVTTNLHPYQNPPNIPVAAAAESSHSEDVAKCGAPFSQCLDCDDHNACQRYRKHRSIRKRQ